MARPERVAFSLLLASSSCKNDNHLSHHLPQRQWHHCHIHHRHFHPFHCCQRLPCSHFESMSWHFSVLVDQLLEDSLFGFILRSEGLTAPTFKRVRGSRSCFTNDIAFLIILDKKVIPGSMESKPWLYC